MEKCNEMEKEEEEEYSTSFSTALGDRNRCRGSQLRVDMYTSRRIYMQTCFRVDVLAYGRVFVQHCDGSYLR